MVTNTTHESAEEALEHAYAEEADYWRQFIGGGWISCATPEAAWNLRYRMYRARKLLKATGIKAYDDMVIRLEKGDHRLRIERRNNQVVELLPDDPT